MAKKGTNTNRFTENVTDFHFSLCSPLRKRRWLHRKPLSTTNIDGNLRLTIYFSKISQKHFFLSQIIVRTGHAGSIATAKVLISINEPNPKPAFFSGRKLLVSSMTSCIFKETKPYTLATWKNMRDVWCSAKTLQSCLRSATIVMSIVLWLSIKEHRWRWNTSKPWIETVCLWLQYLIRLWIYDETCSAIQGV